MIKNLQRVSGLVILGLLFHLSPVSGMENRDPRKATVRQVPSQDKAVYVAKDWLEAIKKTYQNTNNPSQSHISVNANIITEASMLKAFENAAQKGVNVELLISEDSLQYMKKSPEWTAFLQNPTFPVKIFVSGTSGTDHAKFFLTKYTDKNDTMNWFYSIGSANFTPMGMFHSNEVIQIVENKDFENYKKLQKTFNELYQMGIDYRGQTKKELHEQQARESQAVVVTPQRPKQKAIVTTPEERQIYSTIETFIWETIAGRFKRYDIGEEKSGDVYISSMTWNSPELTQQLMQLHEDKFNIEIFVDKAVLRNNTSKKQLFKLVEDGVKVYVYFGDGYKIQHAKFVLIKKMVKGKATSSVSSTTQNVSVDNVDTDLLVIDPGKEVTEDYLKIVDSYRKNQNMHLLTHENFDGMVRQANSTASSSRKPKRKLLELDLSQDDAEQEKRQRTK